MNERTCPTCGQPIATEEPQETTAASLLQWCRDRGYNVSADGSVVEDVAAAILERAPITLRNWRAQGRGPRWRNNGRVRYRLVDLAAWLNGDHDD
jgi:hypothetical protein